MLTSRNNPTSTAAADPDLQVTNLTTANTSATSLNVSWQDQNTGNAPVNQPWIDQVTVTNSAGTVLATALVPSSITATTYNPTTDFSVANGNPNGVWSYGWMDTGFTTFTQYVNHFSMGWTGSLIKGSGLFGGALNINSGGLFSPGNSPGLATSNSGSLNPGGQYLFEISDATDQPGVGMDLWDILHTLTITAGSNSPFTIHLATLNASGASGLAADFNPWQSYQWTLIHTNDGIAGFAPTDFVLDTTGFLNPTSGTFFVKQSGPDMVLDYSSVPEPASLVLVALVALALLRRRRRCG